MARRFGFKPSLRDQRIAVNASLMQLAAASGRPMPEGLLNEIAPIQRRTAPKQTNEPQERDIQRAILDYLHLHPKVAFIGRFNSGAVQSNYNGHASYVRFHTIKGFPDLHGCTKSGRAIYLEVKRPREAIEGL